MMTMKIGDQAFFYHSNCKPPHIIGIVEIVRESYPDHTALDKKSIYYDPKASKENPRWFMVDVKPKKRLKNIVTLEELKSNPKLKDMRVTQKGQRLSVQPVEKKEFDEVIKAEDLENEEELNRLRQLLDQQLLQLKNFISKLANKLQRRLLAKQNRSWEFDLEEGLLDTSKLTRVIMDPLNSLSYKKLG